MGFFDQIRQSLSGVSGETDPESNLAPGVKDASQQPDDEKRLAGWVKSKVEEVRSNANRVTQEGVWMTNIAYLLGFNSVFYDTQLKQYRPINRGQGNIKRGRIHANMILPACQNRLARLCKNPPRYEVRPNTQETADKEAAMLAMDIINDIWDKQAINTKRLELIMWVQQCGHAYIKTCWDSFLGESLYNPDGSFSGEFEGAVRVDVVSPFEVFVDPLAKSLAEAKWLIHAKVRKLEYFKEQYPERGGLVQAEGAWLQSAQYDLRINSLTSNGSTSGSNDMASRNAAIELSYYETRTRKHPNGRLIIVANGVLLENKELPIGELNFAKFDDVIIGGKFYPESCITHARPLQDQYDRNLQKTTDWINKLVAGKYITVRGHDLIQEGFHDQSGEILEYTQVPGAAEPHAIAMPVIPSFVYQEREELKNELFAIFGLSEVSRGNIPAAGIPAVGMQLLVEQDETRIAIETEQHEHSYAAVGRHILKYTEEYAKSARQLKKKAKTSDYVITDYTGEDIHGNFDVQVVRGSTIPNNKFMNRQEILNGYQQGLLGDPADPSVREEVFSRLQFGDVNGLWEDHIIDMQQINRTVKQLESGQQPEIDEMQNHQLHIKIKNRYIKTEKFEQLDPQIQAMFILDREDHVQALMHLQNPTLDSADDQNAQMEQQSIEQVDSDMNQPAPGVPEEQIATEQVQKPGGM